MPSLRLPRGSQAAGFPACISHITRYLHGMRHTSPVCADVASRCACFHAVPARSPLQRGMDGAVAMLLVVTGHVATVRPGGLPARAGACVHTTSGRLTSLSDSFYRMAFHLEELSGPPPLPSNGLTARRQVL